MGPAIALASVFFKVGACPPCPAPALPVPVLIPQALPPSTSIVPVVAGCSPHTHPSVNTATDARAGGGDEHIPLSILVQGELGWCRRACREARVSSALCFFFAAL